MAIRHRKPLFILLFIGSSLGSLATTAPASAQLRHSSLQQYNGLAARFENLSLVATVGRNPDLAGFFDLKLTCLHFSTKPRDRQAWDIDLFNSSEIMLSRTGRREALAILGHLPALRQELCSFIAPRLPMPAETIASIITRITGAQTEALFYGQYIAPQLRNIVSLSQLIFRPEAEEAHIDHLGATLIIRSQAPGSLTCQWDANVFNAPFPSSIDPTLPGNRHLCELQRLAAENQIPLDQDAERLSLPPNPFGADDPAVIPPNPYTDFIVTPTRSRAHRRRRNKGMAPLKQRLHP